MKYKTFEVSMTDIADMNTDLTDDTIQLDDAETHKIKDFEVEIVDADGKKVNAIELMDNVRNHKETLPAAIDVLYEATHSGVNRNSWNYHSDSMLKDTKTWKYPYAKPFLKNHDMYSEPLGRVREAYHGTSEFNTERDCINIVYRITDSDAIEKFLDGRYRTMSIGGSVGHVQCGICGKDILKDGIFKFCGHWRGETYAGQKAIWNARDIEYKEGSVVNNPADDWAQVKKITIVEKDKSEDNEAEDNLKGQENAEIADNLLNDNEENTSIEANEPTTDNNDGEETNEVNDNEENEEKGKEVKTEDDYKEMLSTKDTEIGNLNIKIKDLNSELSKLNSTIDALTNEKNSFMIENETLKDEISTSKKTAINMALAYKETMAKRLADFYMYNGEINDKEYKDKVNEFIKKSASELKKLSDEIKIDSAKIIKTVKKVENPSLANKDKEDKESVKNNNNNCKTIEESIIDSIVR